MSHFFRADRRLTPRTKVAHMISINVGHTTPAFQDKTEPQEEDTKQYMGQVHDISDKGMCITTQNPLEEHYFVNISIIQDTEYTTRDNYSGVITWCSYEKENNNYRYGIEFLSTWIRRKIDRKYKKMWSTL